MYPADLQIREVISLKRKLLEDLEHDEVVLHPVGCSNMYGLPSTA
jgi:hypothetical protein